MTQPPTAAASAAALTTGADLDVYYDSLRGDPPRRWRWEDAAFGAHRVFAVSRAWLRYGQPVFDVLFGFALVLLAWVTVRRLDAAAVLVCVAAGWGMAGVATRMWGRRPWRRPDYGDRAIAGHEEVAQTLAAAGLLPRSLVDAYGPDAVAVAVNTLVAVNALAAEHGAAESRPARSGG